MSMNNMTSWLWKRLIIPTPLTSSWLHNSEHRELYRNMGMCIEYTIILMMRLKSFRLEVDKSMKRIAFVVSWFYKTFTPTTILVTIFHISTCDDVTLVNEKYIGSWKYMKSKKKWACALNTQSSLWWDWNHFVWKLIKVGSLGENTKNKNKSLQ
jgi:hypothetical protein